MKEAEILASLEDIVQKLGIELRYDKGDFQGGLCRVGDRQIFLLNSRLLPSQKIQILARELSRCNLANVYIIPAVRSLIEQYASAQSRTEA